MNLMFDKKQEYFSTIDENNIVSFLRTNFLVRDDIINKYLLDNQPFYVYYMDGDGWSNIYYFCTSLCFYLMNLCTFKDSLSMYADEFLIFDNIYYKDAIDLWNKNNTEKVTTVILKCMKYDILPEDLINYVKQLMKDSKKLGRGVIYEYTYN